MKELRRGEIVWAKWSREYWPCVVFEQGLGFTNKDTKFHVVWLDGTFCYDVSESRILDFSSNWEIRLTQRRPTKKFTQEVNKAVKLLYQASDPTWIGEVDHTKIESLGKMTPVLREEQLRILSGMSRHDHYFQPGAGGEDPLDKKLRARTKLNADVKTTDSNGGGNDKDLTLSSGEPMWKRMRIQDENADKVDKSMAFETPSSLKPNMLLLPHEKWKDWPKQYRIGQLVWARHESSYWPAIVLAQGFLPLTYKAAVLDLQLTCEVGGSDIEDFVLSWNKFRNGSKSKLFIAGLRRALDAVFRFACDSTGLHKLVDFIPDPRSLNLEQFIQPNQIVRVPRAHIEEVSNIVRPSVILDKPAPMAQIIPPMQMTAANPLKLSSKKTIRP